MSDIVTDGDLPDVVKQNMSAWAGCIAGAMDVNDYVAAIEAAGFVDVEVQRSYWDDEIINATVEQLDPELQAQLENAREEGRGVMLIKEGAGHTELIEIAEPENGNFDPAIAVFSARVTAYKPE